MAVYRGDRPVFLEAAIKSTVQPSADTLLIGIDGPIGPELERVLDEATAGSSVVRIVRFEVNRGLAFVLNDLIDIALGDPDCEFISRMDADDVCVPGRFAKQIEFLRQNRQIDIAGCAARVIDETGTPRSTYCKPRVDADLKRRLPFDSPFIHPTVIMRASLLRQEHRYPTHTIRFEDVALWSHLAAAGAVFGNLPDQLIDYRYSLQTATRRTGLKKVMSETAVRVSYLNRMMPWRVDILISVIVVAVAKVALPPALLSRAIALRSALT
jgi:glycosyltransferase involved in cell wall biosynthesis